jgi:hypothetical protein
VSVGRDRRALVLVRTHTRLAIVAAIFVAAGLQMSSRA